jgi:hypothetical protein
MEGEIMSEYKIGQRVRLHEGVISVFDSLDPKICVTFPSGHSSWVSEAAIAEILPDPIKAGEHVQYKGIPGVVKAIDGCVAWVALSSGARENIPVSFLVRDDKSSE